MSPDFDDPHFRVCNFAFLAMKRLFMVTPDNNAMLVFSRHKCRGALRVKDPHSPMWTTFATFCFN